MLPLYKHPQSSIITYILSILNNNKLLTLKHLHQIHGQIISNTQLISTPIITAFLHSCHHSHNPNYALQFLYNLPSSYAKPSIWGSLIKTSLESTNNLMVFFNCYNGMMYHEISPNVGMFALIFRYSAKFGDRKLGELFHCVVGKLGFGKDVVLQTGLVDLYAKVSDLDGAKKAFDEMSQRDVVACNVMISVLGKHGFVEDARCLFDSMLEKDSYSWNSMISSYFKIGDIDSARFLFDKNPIKNEVCWNILIDGYSKSGYSSNTDNFEDLVTLYNQMQYSDVRPSHNLLSLIIQCCASFCATQLGQALHCQIFKLNLNNDVVLQTGLLDFYAKVGNLSSAKRVFDEMSHKDVVANNAMISALSKHGFVQDARNLFDDMPEKNSATWNSMITCYAKSGDVDSALFVFDSNPVKDIVSWNAMIDGYCKSGNLSSAEELFTKTGNIKNSVTWNTMITGFVQCHEYRRALHLFEVMQSEKVGPTEVTMVSLLSACAHLGALDMGEWVHGYIKKNKLKIDVVLGNAIIDMYCKCGSISSALDAFHKLKVKNSYCWNSVIIGLAMHGYGNEAISYFVKMIEEGLNPDGVTFVGLLCGCSHSGLVSEGRLYFSQMRSVYGVEPGIEHYGCMVDLLGRSGQLLEALELVNNMPLKPNAVVWGSLLRSCNLHKNTEIGEQVTQRLLELDPHDGGNYVFLSNLYASLSRWKDVDRCRKLMIESGVHKVPGFSSIEADNVVHEFVAGDSSHPQFLQINAFLVEIGKKLKDEGYEPNTGCVLHDIDDEEKEGSVSYHSERIAVAFGLMSTPCWKEIRVVKNLRTCDDCHTVMKLISKIYEREIIMRDRSRFHHFKNGVCSCKDYW
ncbi:pentatricopeptide repeat-containing protein ELI1, chloroplastic-like [Rutidosis leptorrhynchoides]|uniref:pentatricopeptide repeat-containing protein ELI1, chloroplastic-like n=1 Tax=Rutidosis leptorrhynchoides TaxID=125765 RepID=UPI003A9A44C8